MNLSDIFLRLYRPFFGFIAKNRIEKKDIDLRHMHNHIAVVAATGILMWGYAFVAILTISHPLPGYIGLICSILHGLSPFLFIISNNTFLISFLMLGLGVLHQGTFAYFTGGFYSHILIWYGVIPMLGGLISGRKSAALWSIIVGVIALSFLGLELRGHEFPNLISKTGGLISRTMIVFGYIFLSSLLFSVFLRLNEAYENNVTNQKNQVQNLFRVLLHDMTNPLMVVMNYTKRSIRSNSDNEKLVSDLSKVQKAAHIMKDISDSVRRMEAIKDGKISLKLSEFFLSVSIYKVKDSLYDRIKAKDLIFLFDLAKYKNYSVMMDRSLFETQVITNIYTNAIKFTPKGGRIITTIENSDSHTIVEVYNDGEQIPEESIKLIFSDQITSSIGTQGEKGTGYGLNIAKNFMEKFNGEIGIENSDYGVTVSLVFPRIEK